MSWKRILLLAAIALPTPAMAQDDWEFTATLYGWFPGVSTTVETPFGEVEADVDFDEVLEALDLAFLGAIEARRGRWSLIGDVQFFDIGAEHSTPLPGFGEVGIDSKMTLFSGYGMYAIVDSGALRLDVGGGVRIADASFDTRLTGQNGVPDASFAADGSWADLLIAARVQRVFDDRWYGVAYVDVGGFGIGDSSELTWQAFGGAGYRFGESWSTVVGYRHLSVDRVFDRADLKTELSGPFLGVQKSF